MKYEEAMKLVAAMESIERGQTVLKKPENKRRLWVLLDKAKTALFKDGDLGGVFEFYWFCIDYGIDVKEIMNQIYGESEMKRKSELTDKQINYLKHCLSAGCCQYGVTFEHLEALALVVIGEPSGCTINAFMREIDPYLAMTKEKFNVYVKLAKQYYLI